ncbi:ABC transporter permease [Rhizocola hellebori]|uniref:ABC transporter permease n=1 Tax=Rhizocola hellebori TaxID=1392758 RepID=A0A8J3VGK7_9ACTN|nr:ABC transporter permease [Rhizocola hellebori]GIH05247.1 ABC transporter permease [Rhizocola hellebori]
MNAALYAEMLKLRTSRLPWITALAITVGVAAGGMFMFISLHPERARDLGLLGSKAQLAMLEPTWDSYLSLLAQISAVGGLGIFGMIMVWVFGREFADHTAKDLLALPTSRTATVMAKFATAATWGLCLTVYLAAAGIGVGFLLGVPGASLAQLGSGVLRILVTAALTIALTATFGLAASIGRGYLPAVGTLFATLFTAQIVAALGYGAWFPFSVPALHAGLAAQQTPTAIGYLGVAAVAAASALATTRWWQHADHTR